MLTAGRYALALVLCSVAVTLLLDLPHADLAVPFWYDGDALYYGAVVRAIAENGWWLTNSRLGMPFGQEMHDFPMPDTFSFVLLRALGCLVADDVRRLNIFYLASFPLTTLTTLWVLRRLAVSYWPALLASLLYAFTPHRLVWGEYHLMYTVYWPVPLFMLLALRIATGDLALTGWRDVASKRWLPSLAVCALVASSGGIYQPFFACVVMCSLGVYSAVRGRSLKLLLLPCLLCLWTFVVLALNMLPSLWYRAHHGATETAQRQFFEAESFALKITQLLLPVADHRIEAWAAARRTYDIGGRLGDPCSPLSLGILGSFGFLGLIGWLLYRRGRSGDGRAARLFDALSVANATLVLCATVGGVGALFAFFVSPQIRGYDRAVIYLALLAFTAAAMALDAVRARVASSPTRSLAFAVAILGLLPLALLDQTPRRVCPDFASTKQTYARDRAFFAGVERAVPVGAMVFQLPRQAFPEGESYEHLKAYLHTDRVRWSFGAMRGRLADRWQRDVVSLPPAELVDTLALAGFAGICCDRVLGGTQGKDLEAVLVARLGEPLVSSADGRYVFVSLMARAQELDQLADAPRRRELALHRIYITWGADFTGGNGAPVSGWRACGARGAIVVDNDLSRPRPVRLTLSLVAAQASTLTATSPFLREQLGVGKQPTTFTREVVLPPGRSLLELTTDAPPLVLQPAGPPMAFGISDLSVRDIDE